MDVFPLLLVVVVGLYAGGLFWVTSRIDGLARRGPDPPVSLPSISIVVPARDEEHTLPRCLDALLKQVYPVDRLEILVVDDHSTDRTSEVAARYQQLSRSLRLVALPEPVAGETLRGKARALHAAIEEAGGELVLICDADCAPPPGWARRFAAHFDDPSVGMVCGMTVVEAHRLLDHVQAYDWIYLMTFAAVLAEVGRPITAMGNNMALRRSAYEAVGGYPALPFSVTEDFVLFQAVRRLPGRQARLPLDPEICNVTLPLPTLREVIRQRRRWARGGLRARPWVHGIYYTGVACHALLLAGLWWTPATALVMLVLKAGADFALSRRSLAVFRHHIPRWAFPCFEVYLFTYIVLMPLALLVTPRVVWKDRKL